MKKNLICLLSAAILAITVTGCFSPDRREFDVQTTVAEPNAVPMTFGVFRNISGADRRFMLRRENSEIVFDESSLWVLSPDNLMEKEMRILLMPRADAAPDAKPLLLSCVIYRFDFDLARHCAVLGAEFTLMRELRKVTWNQLFVTAYTGNSAEAQAAAMGQSFRDAAKSVGEHAAKFAAPPAEKAK